MGKSLVLFDTEHIKEYVFGTDKLREIRGASSILDSLNRFGMTNLADDPAYQAISLYTNGGDGLFFIDSNKAHNFGRDVQHMYRVETGDGASISYAVQELPEHIKTVEDAKDIPEYLESLRWQLREMKLIPQETISLPSHPFMRPCDSCGVFYAAPDEGDVNRDPGELQELYCKSCQRKRLRDVEVKKYIEKRVEPKKKPDDEHDGINDYLWGEVIGRLRKKHYDLNGNPERPRDFNVFRNFKGSKEYLALVYADANSMEKTFGDCQGLKEYQDLAMSIDRAIYEAVCTAIAQYLKVSDHVKPSDPLTFPFDILLMGGDDVLMVVPATVALDVALTITNVFHMATKQQSTLTVGVVLVPITYPFRLSEQLVTTTVRFAKDVGNGEPRINFLTVAGSAAETFKKVYTSFHSSTKANQDSKATEQFFATLRPYDPASLSLLLKDIRGGRSKNLGRSKLHQMREAILKMNLSTSVSESRAVLMNWNPDQRDYVIDHVYGFAKHFQDRSFDPQNPESLRYHVTFPWFTDGENQGRAIYRTSLLDFIELYNFISGEETAGGNAP